MYICIFFSHKTHVRHEIMKINGFNADAVPYSEVKELVAQLVDDASKEHEFEKKEQLHPKCDKLDKFWYVKCGKKTTVYSEEKERLDRTADLKQKDAKALALGEDAKDAGAEVKIQNPSYQAFKTRLKVVVSGKLKLAAILEKCQDVLISFQKKQQDLPDEYKACQMIHEEVQEKVKSAEKVLETLRSHAFIIYVCSWLKQSLSFPVVKTYSFVP